MNTYVTGAMIRRLREEKGLTQLELAERLHVSDKSVSKWETGRGYPDITLIEPIAQALGASVQALLSGDAVTNTNRAFNMLRSKFYVCPVCGNVVRSTGEATISCCGITLPPLDAEAGDEAHALRIEPVEDEYYVTMEHEMTKAHFISFIAAVSDDGMQLVKLYPEGSAEARFKRGRVRYFFYYCNHHGLFRETVRKKG